MTTKILALTDALGNMADFCLLPGLAHDLRGVPELIKGLHADHMLADRAFDADWLWKSLSEHASCLSSRHARTANTLRATTKKCTNGGIWLRTSFRRSNITEG